MRPMLDFMTYGGLGLWLPAVDISHGPKSEMENLKENYEKPHTYHSLRDLFSVCTNPSLFCFSLSTLPDPALSPSSIIDFYLSRLSVLTLTIHCCCLRAKNIRKNICRNCLSVPPFLSVQNSVPVSREARASVHAFTVCRY